MTAETTTDQCLAVYAGSLWRGERCRETADHQAVAHLDRYEWSGQQHEDAHEAHPHHVDQYGRTWTS